MDIFKDKKVLITGHTGFKGGWLYVWLQMLGAKVYGYSLSPQPLSHFNMLTHNNIIPDVGHNCDIRDFELLNKAIDAIQPDIIFNLAAQAIVEDARVNPHYTFETNIMGIVNLLEICKGKSYIKGIVNVVTDKVFENHNWVWGYRENDPLATGYQDPYNASKVCVNIIANSYQRLLMFPVVNAYAGNTIAGGDFSAYRLIPDIIRDIMGETPIQIRNSQAIRPWTFVLDVLMGYLLLGKKILKGEITHLDTEEGYNFGPEIPDCISVGKIISLVENLWCPITGKPLIDNYFCGDSPTLKLDSTKSRALLKWKPQYNINETIEKTIDWYKAYYERGLLLTQQQIEDYMKRLKNNS